MLLSDTLVKVDNQPRHNAVIIVNPVPFDEHPRAAKTVLWCNFGVIIPGTCLKFDHVRYVYVARFPIHTTPPIRKIRYTSVTYAIIIVSIVLRDDLSFPWIWLSPVAICANHFLSVITHAIKARAISEIIGAMARRKVRGEILWWCVRIAEGYGVELPSYSDFNY